MAVIGDAPLANEGNASTLPAISDEQLHDCLFKISILPHETSGATSPTTVAEDLSAIMTANYYAFPDSVGFGFVPDPSNLLLSDQPVSWRVAVPPELASEFPEVSAALTEMSPQRLVTLEPVARPGTVRQVCATFLDALNNPEIKASASSIGIDPRRNQVVIISREPSRITAAAAARYGDLAVVEGGQSTSAQE